MSRRSVLCQCAIVITREELEVPSDEDDGDQEITSGDGGEGGF